MCIVIAQLLILYNSIQTYNIMLYIKINTDFSKYFYNKNKIMYTLK